MTAVTLAFLLTGLVLGVVAMLHGTERRALPHGAPHERRTEHNPASEPSALFNLSSVAAFAFAFGLTGYLLTRYVEWPWYAQLLVALGAGAAAYALQALLIARWAIPSARADQVDTRFLLQGTLARVVDAAPAGGVGRLLYTLDGAEYQLPVRAMDGEALAVGTEVVIDHLDEGVAVCEPWASVEQRL
ncbi:hypothetical protein [Gemmatimonas sp. UBA7669]|uniref:hypothetical protein n=1 Tax=Gemmatimonas sp. UBA7669 TaxID=1946568 RepID=UPI0025BF75A4|nr:hypothetical protein [Gemmatimonas sp. UBA7669]